MQKQLLPWKLFRVWNNSTFEKSKFTRPLIAAATVDVFERVLQEIFIATAQVNKEGQN